MAPAARGPVRPAADLELLARQVRELCAGAPDELAGVGVAMPATLDAAGVVTAWPNRPDWTGLDLRGALREVFGAAEVLCADDGDLAALAEAHAADRPDLLYLGVGTGVGGGIVLGGRTAARPVAGLLRDRPPDRGPVRGPAATAGAAAVCSPWPRAPPYCAVPPAPAAPKVTFPELAQAFADGTPWAADAVREGCAALAAAAVGVGELLRPALVVVGGGFADALAGFTGQAPVAADRARLGPPPVFRRPPWSPPASVDSSLHGAVLLATGRPPES